MRHYKTSITTTLILITIIILNSCTFNKNIEKKKLVVKEDSLNLGRLSLKDSISIYFTLDNPSEGDIKIVKAGSSCGCSHVNIGDSIIKSKIPKKISVRFLIADTGYFKKSIVLETDADQKYTLLYFYGENFY